MMILGILAEDTFILLDALEEDAAELRENKPRVCLEIGCVALQSSSVSLLNGRTDLAQDVYPVSLGRYWDQHAVGNIS